MFDAYTQRCLGGRRLRQDCLQFRWRGEKNVSRQQKRWRATRLVACFEGQMEVQMLPMKRTATTQYSRIRTMVRYEHGLAEDPENGSTSERSPLIDRGPHKAHSRRPLPTTSQRPWRRWPRQRHAFQLPSALDVSRGRLVWTLASSSRQRPSCSSSLQMSLIAHPHGRLACCIHI